MLFAFFHELGHIIVGLLLGLKPEKLGIMPIGFSISFKIDAKSYGIKIVKSNLFELKKIFIALAGPIVNLVFIVVLLLFEFNLEFVYINLVIFLFNMLPIYPLDGGRILKSLACLVLGSFKALCVTNVVSNLVLALLTVLVFWFCFAYRNVAFAFALTYLWFLAIRENRVYRFKVKLYKFLKNYIEINEY